MLNRSVRQLMTFVIGLTLPLCVSRMAYAQRVEVPMTAERWEFASPSSSGRWTHVFKRDGRLPAQEELGGGSPRKRRLQA
jgi:hypothetical protein